MLANKNKVLTLSLVIPVFNEEGYLQLCLGSIAKQTILPAEVIVVDNNSTDNSARTAQSFPFVKLIKEGRQGVLHARNRGFDTASGDIIARIDADTILPPRWVENVIKTFSEARVAAVTGPVDYYDMPFPTRNHHPDHFMRRSIYNWSPKSPFLFGSNMAIRRSAWRSVRKSTCSGQEIHEDLDLAIHLYKSSQHILYTKNLLAGASGRRYNDPPSKFIHYMKIYRRTYLDHGMHSLAIYSATGVYLLGYVVVHPWLSLWYRGYGLLRPLIPLQKSSRRSPNW